MRYVFIDLGAYNGDSTKEFMSRQARMEGDVKLPVSPKKFELYIFEPNPRFEPDLGRLREIYPNIKEISSKIAWTEDGESEFTLDLNDCAYGSTIMKSKRNWAVGKVETMPTFNFSEWLKQFEDCYVVVKMDIEGAEFPVLEKLIADGTDTIIDQLWVEMHPNKVRDYTWQDAENLLARLNCGKVELWH